MSKLKTILKWLLIIIVFLGIALFAAVKIMSEKRPEAIKGMDGDKLAMEMLNSLNKPAWDSLKYLKWEFMRGQKYLWDKQNNAVVVEWNDNKVILDLDQIDGVAFKGGQKITGEEKNASIQKAWSIWCNDSFWMFAPYKIFDPGTKREIVKTADGEKGLMVTYESGGVTPGDSYLWLLDDNNIPTGFKMWTSIIPVKGIYISWENWKTIDGGAKLAISHKSPLLSFDMKGVQEGDSPSDLGFSNDIFKY